MHWSFDEGVESGKVCDHSNTLAVRFDHKKGWGTPFSGLMARGDDVFLQQFFDTGLGWLAKAKRYFLAADTLKEVAFGRR